MDIEKIRIQSLLQSFKDPRLEIRSKAVTAIAQLSLSDRGNLELIRTLGGINLFLNMLHEQDENILSNAAFTIMLLLSDHLDDQAKFENNNGIELTLHLLSNNSPFVRENASGIFSILSKASSNSQVLIQNAGAIKNLSILLNDSNPKAASNALVSLVYLSKESLERRQLLLNKESISLLMNFIRKSGSLDDAKKDALILLGMLAEVEGSKTQLLLEKADMEVLISMLESADSDLVRQNATFALGRLIFIEGNQKLIEELSIASRLLTVMKNLKTTTEKVIVNFIHILAKLARNSIESCKTIIELGGSDFFLSLFQQVNSNELKKDLIHLLAFFLTKDMEDKKFTSGSVGIQNFVKMLAHEDENILSSAMKCLVCLLRSNPEAQAKFQSIGGVSLTIPLFFHSNLDIKRNAENIFLAFFKNEKESKAKSPSVGLISILLEFLCNGNAEKKNAVLLLLNFLLEVNLDAQTEFSKLNGIEYVITLLSNRHELIINNSAIFLGKLLIRKNDVIKQTLLLDTVKSLIALFGSSDSSVRENSLFAFSCLLNSEDECRAFFIAESGVKKLISLVEDQDLFVSQNAKTILLTLATGSDERRDEIRSLVGDALLNKVEENSFNASQLNTVETITSFESTLDLKKDAKKLSLEADTSAIPTNQEKRVELFHEFITRVFNSEAKKENKGVLDSSTNDIEENYKVLNESFKLAKEGQPPEYPEIDISFIHFKGERPSQGFINFFKSSEEYFSRQATLKDLDVRSTSNFFPEKTFSEFFENELKGFYQFAGNCFTNIYDVIDYKTKNLPSNDLKVTLSLDFVDMISLLKTFIQGDLYGKPLEDTILRISTLCKELASRDTYKTSTLGLHKESSKLSFFLAIHGIISAKINDINKQVQAFFSLLSFIHSERYFRKEFIINLYLDNHFRNFSLSMLYLYWLDKSPLKSFSESKNIFYSRLMKNQIIDMLDGADHELRKVFSLNCPNELRKAAFAQIDLYFCNLGYGPRLNSLFVAGVALQHAALKEVDLSKALASESMALILYDEAVRASPLASPVVQKYISIHVAKYISQLRFPSSTVPFYEGHTPKEIFIREASSQFSESSRDLRPTSFDIEKIIKGCIKKVIYLHELTPFVSEAVSHIDLVYLELLHLGYLKETLSRALYSNLPSIEREKASYHLYEGSLQSWIPEDQRKEYFTLSVDEFLTKAGSSTELMGRHLVSTMLRDSDGFFSPTKELRLIKSEPGYYISQVNGFEINYTTGRISWLLVPWESSMPVHERLLTMYDIWEMVQLGTEGGILSLNHPDPRKFFHPLKKAEVSATFNGPLFDTALNADILLKIISTGIEPSIYPPYNQRSSEALTSNFPSYLRDLLLPLVGSTDLKGPHINRLWIEPGKIDKTENFLKKDNKDQVLRVELGGMDMFLKASSMIFNEEGGLIDDPLQTNTSTHARFADNFTKNYPEIGKIFPEYLRLAQLIRVAAVISMLKSIREKNQVEANQLKPKSHLHQAKLNQYSRIEEEFVRMGLANRASTPSPPIFVPSVIRKHELGSVAIYGGVLAVPKLQRCISLDSKENRTIGFSGKDKIKPFSIISTMFVNESTNEDSIALDSSYNALTRVSQTNKASHISESHFAEMSNKTTNETLKHADRFGENHPHFSYTAFFSSTIGSEQDLRLFPTTRFEPYSPIINRTDVRPPSEIFQTGFEPRSHSSANPPPKVPFYYRIYSPNWLKRTVLDHVHAETFLPNKTPIVSFSTSEAASSVFPTDYRGVKFLYKIDQGRVSNAIDFEGFIKSAAEKHPGTGWADYLPEKEVGVLGKVDPKAVVGCYKCSADGRYTTIYEESFIRNPDYKPTVSEIRASRLVSGLNAVGKIATPVAAVQDSYFIYKGYEASNEENQYRPLKQRALKIASAWVCAISAGGKAGLAASELGPLGVAIAGIIGGGLAYGSCSASVDYLYPEMVEADGLEEVLSVNGAEYVTLHSSHFSFFSEHLPEEGEGVDIEEAASEISLGVD